MKLALSTELSWNILSGSPELPQKNFNSNETVMLERPLCMSLGHQSQLSPAFQHPLLNPADFYWLLQTRPSTD